MAYQLQEINHRIRTDVPSSWPSATTTTTSGCPGRG